MHQKQAINFLNTFNKILNVFTKMHTVRRETWQHLKKCFFNNSVGLATNKRHITIAFQVFFQVLLYYGIMFGVY